MAKSKYRFRWSAIAAAIAALALLLAGCGGNAEPGAQAEAASGGQAEKTETYKLKIADILTNPVFRVAKSKGFFEKYGIDAELVTFATPAEGINSLFIKQVDIAWGADFPVLNAVSKGDYSIIASTWATENEKNAAQWKLFVRDGIESPADLKGKKLSTLRGTFVSYLWDEYLTQNGVDPNEVEQIGQGGFDESYVALKQGDVDAAWVSGSNLSGKFEQLEGAHQLTDMSKTSVRIGGAIIAPNELVNGQGDVIKRFLQAVEESTAYAAANPEETADILFKEVKQPKDATLKDLSTSNWQLSFSQASFDSLAKQKKYMVEKGIIQNDFDLNGKINLDAVKQVVPDRVTYAK
ncbi:ABC transporter substrate-binding protein [Paenibacillus thailandensis]|uniref:ABC transporter substrate-binding protein n=1 Tax=Paenibacillus thailandensis TaxID=393250 RepID=A0ABW5QXX7_9BACL